ncbi:hypothetical protein KI809_18015 [Geobacter pelophilus]|jgi:hypothetical protein|uniref:Uncharacterized protein n=1 Tax=Geoanaerobacter pelophilus TaxID=60036 RepID=A0AAW4L7S4_9BACT|nr:hypothetical protein [Geoanaerobacter pelophilus]MBT0666212.1 hypothetical protein [Geoanaerobacter pelophilus]
MEKKSEEAQEKLLSELKYLRATLKDVGEAFILRAESEIETLAGYIAGMSRKDNLQVADSWLKEARATSFKPAKGRFKDLKKINHLLEDLLNIIIEKQTTSVPRSRKAKLRLENITVDTRAELQ